MTIFLAQAAGEPMTWRQALITVLAIFAIAIAIVLFVFGERR